jgi:lipooligosaccharide transport system ATP-binding protein
MDSARIVAEGSPRELIQRYVTREVVELRLDRSADREAVVAALKRRGDRIEPLADRVHIYTHEGDRVAHEVDSAEFGAVSAFVRRASLEDVFLMLTGRTLED